MSAVKEFARPQLFLTPDEVSRELQVPMAELRQLRREGRGPKCVALTSRSVLYFASDVAERKRKRR